MAYSTEQSDAAGEETRVLLVGSQGAGKSATGNTILMRNCFNESNDPIKGGASYPVTHSKTLTPGKILSVTDSPDLSIYRIDQDGKKRVNLIGHFSPGPHVIILVISAKHITNDIRNTIAKIREVFDDNWTNHLIVLFTHIDQLYVSRGYKGLTSIEEHVKQVKAQVPFLKELLSKCNDRFIGFNNTLGWESPDQVGELLKMIENMHELKDGKYYTTRIFREVENAMIDLDKKTGSRANSREVLEKVAYKYSLWPWPTIGLGVMAGYLLGFGYVSFGLTFAGGIVLIQRAFSSLCFSDIERAILAIKKYEKDETKIKLLNYQRFTNKRSNPLFSFHSSHP